jgi:hypothetical protein
LRELADIVAAAAAPLAACRAGCAQCCYLPVAISRVEADFIAEQTGTPAAPVERSVPLRSRGPGHPCPFLEGDQCSIYANRPIACRLHFNLDVDALLCTQLPGRSPPAPLLDVRNLHLLYALVCDDAPVADIRDFFASPPGRLPG